MASSPSDSVPTGWKSGAPRAEIAPTFSYDPSGDGTWIITSDRPGQQGHWRKSFPVRGGEFYEVTAWHSASPGVTPRQLLTRLHWRGADGDSVIGHDDMIRHYIPDWLSPAEPEYLVDSETDAAGWTKTTGVYRAPLAATEAILEFTLQNAPDIRAEWSRISFRETSRPRERKVRLAAVNLEPRGGKTAADNCRQFAPLIEEAARQKADLVVLGEFLSAHNLGHAVDFAEPIPGPSSNYFCELAQRHNLYITAGLMERDGDQIYNAAVLAGPEGKLVGQYRKVCPTTGEQQEGVAPGHDFPVFETRFGKVGLMICYDIFFPEVAQALARAGAEIIAHPVYGGHPALPPARAFENQVYIVGSSYMKPHQNWGVTGIHSPEGVLIGWATEPGSVVVVEIDLNRDFYYSSLGNYKARLAHHRPA